jgi:cell volume regulation protein A
MLGGLLVLAYAANRLFQWTRVPDVVVLMIVGVLIGPVTHLLGAEAFADVTGPIGTLALILILFGAGLELNIRDAVRHVPGGLLLGLLAYAGTSALIGYVVSQSLSMSLLSGLLVGAVLGCTSSAIVIPVLEQWKVSPPVKVTLLVEASLGDVLGVLTVGLLLGLRNSSEGIVRTLLGGLLQELGIALVVAAAAGFLWSRLLPRISAQSFWQVLTFAVVLLLYAGTEALHASGLLAVLGFGLALANLPGPPERLRQAILATSAREAPHLQIHEFHGELAFLVRTFFFVLMGVVVEVGGLRSIWPVLPVLLAAIFVVRWAAVWASRWAWHGVSAHEREVVLWVLPRGLITIVLALEIRQAVGVEMTVLPDIAFAIILLTNLMVVLGALRLARAGEPPAQEPLLVGESSEVKRD